MMPVIRISEKTWERLKGYARPLEDSPDDVVQMALDALDNAKGRASPRDKVAVQERMDQKNQPRKAQRAKKLHQKEYRIPLLELLQELGGGASTGDIRKRLEPKIAARLSDADYQPVSNGDPRWWNTACWERNEMVKEGLLRNDSERGFWELAARGTALLKS